VGFTCSKPTHWHIVSDRSAILRTKLPRHK
jgi:hypothetical protein